MGRFRTRVLADAPASWWVLGEASGTSAVDIGSTPHNSTYFNAPTLGAAGLVATEADTSITLSTTSQRVRVGLFYDFVGTASFTFAIKVKPTTIDATVRKLVDKTFTDGSGKQGWNAYIRFDSGSGKNIVVVERWLNGAADSTNSVPAASLVAGQSYEIVWTYNGTQQKLYINGELVNTGNSSKAMVSTTQNLALGNSDSSGGAIIGSIAHARIWTSALTAAQIRGQYQAQTAFPVRPLIRGVNTHISRDAAATQQAEATAIAGLGAQMARMELRWDLIEGTQGSPQWSQFDTAVQKLEALNVEPLFVVVGSPQWANGSADNLVIPDAGSGVTAPFTTWQTAFQTFITAAVNRYKPGGTLGTKVRRWELWNEPNLGNLYWKPTVDSAQYISWYVATRASVLAADPTALVAAGGIANWTVQGSGSQIIGSTWLQALCTANAQLDYVAIHNYSDAAPNNAAGPQNHLPGLKNSFDSPAAMRTLLDTNGYLNTPIWMTEFGWGSNLHGEAGQAAFVEEAFRVTREQWPYVDLALIFTAYDLSSNYGDFGMLHTDLKPKGAGRAFQRVAGRKPGLPGLLGRAFDRVT